MQRAQKIAEYDKLITRYESDPVSFAWDCCGIECLPDQVKMLMGVVEHGHVTIRSGHGTGKSMGIALLIWWYLCTRYKAKIPCTAPTGHQLFDVLWARLSEVKSTLSPIFSYQFDFLSDSIKSKDFPIEWHALARTARPENPEALQGFHGDNLLFVIDEAAGVHNKIFEVALAALTSQGNQCIMAGNPTRLEGYFYDSHHTLRNDWHCLHFNAENSPIVDKASLEKWARYGKDSNIYKIRVLGEFPTSEENQLIPLSDIEKAVERWNDDHREDTGPITWFCDPARYGSDETALAKRQGNRIYEITGIHKKSTMEVAGWIVLQINDSPPSMRPDVVIIDTIGVGAGVYDRLEEMGYNVLPFEASGGSSEDRYANRRAEVYGKCAEALADGRLSIPDDPHLIAQLVSVKYKIQSNGKILLESKEETKKRDMPSPDRADAVAGTFYMSATELRMRTRRDQMRQSYADAEYDEFS